MKEIDTISLREKDPSPPYRLQVLNNLPLSPSCPHLQLYPLLTPLTHTSSFLFLANGTVQPRGLCTACSLCPRHCSSCSSHGRIPLQFSERPSLIILLKFTIVSVPGYYNLD